MTDEETFRQVLRAAMTGDEPELGPQVVAGAVRAWRSARRRRLMAGASATIVVPAVVAGLVVSGIARPGGGPGPAAAPGLSSTPAAPPVVAGLIGGHYSKLAAEALYSFPPANGPQLTLGNQFVSLSQTLQTAEVAACMQRFHFSPQEAAVARYDERYDDPIGGSPMVPGWAGQNESGVANLYDLRLVSRGLLGIVSTGSPNPPANLPAARISAIDARYRGCRWRAYQPFKELHLAGTRLSDLWWKQVHVAQAAPPARAANHDFGICVQRAGAPAQAATSPDAYTAWLGNLLDHMGAPRYHQHIAARTAQDRHWTTIFARCARHVLAVEGRLQLTAQTAFLTRHRAQVLAIETLAVRVIQRLETPSDTPLQPEEVVSARRSQAREPAARERNGGALLESRNTKCICGVRQPRRRTGGERRGLRQHRRGPRTRGLGPGGTGTRR